MKIVGLIVILLLTGCAEMSYEDQQVLMQGMEQRRAKRNSGVDYQCMSDCQARYSYQLCQNRCSY